MKTLFLMRYMLHDIITDSVNGNLGALETLQYKMFNSALEFLIVRNNLLSLIFPDPPIDGVKTGNKNEMKIKLIYLIFLHFLRLLLNCPLYSQKG
jgi:hypothetical protein